MRAAPDSACDADPEEDGTDGFFVAVFERVPAADGAPAGVGAAAAGEQVKKPAKKKHKQRKGG